MKNQQNLRDLFNAFGTQIRPASFATYPARGIALIFANDFTLCRKDCMSTTQKSALWKHMPCGYKVTNCGRLAARSTTQVEEIKLATLIERRKEASLNKQFKKSTKAEA